MYLLGSVWVNVFKILGILQDVNLCGNLFNFISLSTFNIVPLVLSSQPNYELNEENGLRNHLASFKIFFIHFFPMSMEFLLRKLLNI